MSAGERPGLAPDIEAGLRGLDPALLVGTAGRINRLLDAEHGDSLAARLMLHGSGLLAVLRAHGRSDAEAHALLDELARMVPRERVQ